jgi:hypothetical protein
MKPLDQTSQLSLGLTCQNYYAKYQSLQKEKQKRWTKQKRDRIQLIKALKMEWKKDFPSCQYNFDYVMATMARMHDAHEWNYNDRKLHFYENELLNDRTCLAPITFNKTNTACAFLASYNKLTGNSADRYVIFICAYKSEGKEFAYHIEQTPTLSGIDGIYPELRTSLSYPSLSPFFINNNTVCAFIPRVSARKTNLYTFTFGPETQKECISRACFVDLKDGQNPLPFYRLGSFPLLAQNIVQDRSTWSIKEITDTEITFEANDHDTSKFIDSFKDLTMSKSEKNNTVLLQHAITSHKYGSLVESINAAIICHKNIHKTSNSILTNNIYFYKALEESSIHDTKPLENFLKSYTYDYINLDKGVCKLYFYTINNVPYKKLYIEDRSPYTRCYCVNGKPIIIDKNTKCTVACTPIEQTRNQLYKVAVLCTDTQKNQKISLYQTGIHTDTIHKGDIILSDTNPNSRWQKFVAISKPIATNITFNPANNDILMLTMRGPSKLPIQYQRAISGISKFFNQN